MLPVSQKEWGLFFFKRVLTANNQFTELTVYVTVKSCSVKTGIWHTILITKFDAEKRNSFGTTW
jgi:hypothetical protein